MSSGKLVSTTFTSGPLEELAVVDVYKQTSSTIVNSFQDIDSFAIDAFDKAVESSVAEMSAGLLDKIKDLANDPLGEFIEGLSKGVGLPSVASLTAKLGEFGAVGPFKSLSADIMGGMKSLAGGDVTALMCRVEDSAENVFDFISNTGVGIKLDDIVGDLANGNANVLSLIRDLPKATTGLLSGGFGLNQIKQKVFASIGDTVKQLAPGVTSEEARTVTDIMNNVSNGCYNSGINSTGGLAGLLAGLGLLGNRLGLQNPFSSMANCLKDDNLILAAAQPLMRRAMDTGNIGLLNDIARSSAGGSLLSMAPKAIQTVVGALKKPLELSQQGFANYYQGLRGTLDSIDPTWMTHDRAGGSVIDATQIQSNPFVGELIKSQLNETMRPDNYLSNVQAILDSTSGDNDNDILDAVASSPVLIEEFDNEPFMLLSQCYPTTSVASDFDSYFTEYAAAQTSGYSELDW